jgi:hypothetical protein
MRNPIRSREHTSARKKLIILVVALITAPSMLIASLPATVHADVSCSPDSVWETGSSWLNSAGVNVCSPDEGSTNVCVPVSGAPAGTCPAGYVLSGTEWQCVELVNRLYLTLGWINSHWSGDGDTLIDHLPSTLTDQSNGTISYINPGDAITLSGGPEIDGGYPGHVGVINTVSGTTYNIMNQNVPGGVNTSADITSGTLSGGNAELTMAAGTWTNYSIQAIVHSPATASTYENAFQTNTGYLFTYSILHGAVPTTQGMMSGTNPSIAALPNGSYEVAFQTNTGYLDVYNTGTGLTDPLGQSMASGTSPSITALSGGAWEIAYQHGDGNLYTYNSNNGPQAYSLGMASGTSPSITALSSSSIEVAFQANTGNLYVYSNTNGAHNLGDGMGTGTSPSISALTSSAWQIAFQSNSNYLNVYNSANGWTPLTLGMQSGTSPSITTLTSGAYEVAFQANTNYLWVYNNSNGAITTGDGMQSGTSPSIVASSSSAYQIAFQNNGDYLFNYNFNNGTASTAPTTQGMLSSTSPAASVQ